MTHSNLDYGDSAERHGSKGRPTVSICLPNLNTLPFLQERIDSIFGQTFSDWEIVVSDNHSDDGAWEFFQDLAQREPRVRLAQAPREGMYPNWNRCIARARGRYVYIATSDDTMADDCLEKLVSALERHPDCDLAHCPVRIIDEAGGIKTDPVWPDCTTFAAPGMELAQQAHIRRAPYDGLLHLLGRHVYLSLTQLLIRRSLFEKVGDFPSRWGSKSDFNWEMKASLVGSTVHVPDTWASWRVHARQATDLQAGATYEYLETIEEMTADAIASIRDQLPQPIATELTTRLHGRAKEMKDYYWELRNRGTVNRRLYQAGRLLAGPPGVRAEILGQLGGQPKWPDVFASQTRQWLESMGRNSIELLPESSSAAPHGSTPR